MRTVYVGGNVIIPGTDNVGCTENGTSAPISSGDLRRKLARYRHDDPISQYGGPRTGTVEPAAHLRGWTGGTKSDCSSTSGTFPAAAVSSRFHHGQLGWQGDPDKWHTSK